MNKTSLNVLLVFSIALVIGTGCSSTSSNSCTSVRAGTWTYTGGQGPTSAGCADLPAGLIEFPLMVDGCRLTSGNDGGDGGAPGPNAGCVLSGNRCSGMNSGSPIVQQYEYVLTSSTEGTLRVTQDGTTCVATLAFVR